MLLVYKHIIGTNFVDRTTKVGAHSRLGYVAGLHSPQGALKQRSSGCARGLLFLLTSNLQASQFHTANTKGLGVRDYTIVIFTT